MELFETPLPGVGVRYEFTSAAGDRLGVVVRRDGRRDLVLYDEADPDACRDTVTLTGEESAALVELFGGTRVTERVADLRQDIEGLSIEWINLEPGRGLSGKTIGDGRIRTLTGASVVAVLRGEQSIPGPGPDFVLEAGDITVVVGSVPGVQAAQRLLAG
ncbi:MAG: cation:proton antiporter regulatory subunit [Ilumatobacteraceae bacterium]